MNGLVLEAADGVRLEARWDVPEEPRRAAVFCHPHPLHGGTMRGPLMATVARVLVRHGIAVLRFNFRGVGASTGTHGGGFDELADVSAAFAETERTYPGLPKGIAGWSFGANVALRWHHERRAGFPYVGIAPAVGTELAPPLPAPEEIVPAPRTFIFGERDDVIDTPAAIRYAEAIGARVHVIPASGHFFYFREEEVGELTAAGLAVTSP